MWLDETKRDEDKCGRNSRRKPGRERWRVRLSKIVGGCGFRGWVRESGVSFFGLGGEWGGPGNNVNARVVPKG